MSPPITIITFAIAALLVAHICSSERSSVVAAGLRRIRDWQAWALIAVTVVAVRLPAFLLPMNRDSGTFAYGGWRILHGELPYIHFWDNKPPGVFYMDAVAIRLFGPSPDALVLFQVFYGIATAFCFFAIARRLTVRGAALIVTLIFAFYHGSYGLNEDGNYTESYLGLPVLLAVMTILHWSRDRRGYLLPILAGALGVGAGLIKQPGAAVIPAMMLFAIFSGRRQSRYLASAAIAAGAAVAFGVAVAWMAHKGILHGAIDANIVFNRLYFIDAYTYGIGVAKWNCLRGLALVALPLAGAIACMASKRLQGAPVPMIGWLLVPWFLLDLIGIAAGGRCYNHYFICMLPSALLLTSVYVGGVSGGRKVWATAAAGLFLFLGPVWSFHSSSPVNEDPITSIAQQEVFALRWISVRRLGMGATNAAEQAASWIAERTGPTDSIYVWGYDPRIGFLARRAFPSKYIHLHPLGASGFNRDARIRALARDIEVRLPSYIVDQSPLLPTTAPPLASSDSPPSTCPFFRLDGYDPVKNVVVRYYKPVEDIGGCTIYGLR